MVTESSTAPSAAIDAPINLPFSPVPASNGPSNPPPLPLPKLTLTLHTPKSGPLPLEKAQDVIELINAAYAAQEKVSNTFSGDRIWSGPTQLTEEVGPIGYMFIWSATLETGETIETAATATIKVHPGLWDTVPTWDETHAHAEFRRLAPGTTPAGQELVITPEGEAHRRSLKERGVGMRLFELALVATSPKLMRRGVGSVVLADIEAFVRSFDLGQEKGVRTLMAYVVRDIGNEAWYVKRGYRTVGTMQKPKGFWGCLKENGFTKLMMVKEVSGQEGGL